MTPLILTPEQHVTEIQSHWTYERIAHLDAFSDDLIYEHVLRSVADSMQESPPRPIDLTNVAIWVGILSFNVVTWGIVVWELIA